ncbi:5068_t:CDS:2 [Diversispora eburnea]|uniref:phosphatidate cytidylyltransferase n=1 Tax=Diversispora eburnea TaxID=1213867 RepID=A0A9N9A940_9GLOM|nr:5068_t:CDS:2 [Diversispora eburnea]
MTKKRKTTKPHETTPTFPFNQNHEELLTGEERNKTNGITKTEQPSGGGLLVNQSSEIKWKNMTVRAIMTFIMIGGFFVALAIGHFAVIFLVVLIQTRVYNEVIALAHVPSKEKKLPWFKSLNCPKKTWEGFVGAWICTIIFGVLISSVLMQWDYMVCPVVKDLSANVFSGITCEKNPVFIPQKYVLSPWVASLLRRLTFTDIRAVSIAPLQWHVLVMACFASLIAPFGGFFASGVKRAFKIKSFIKNTSLSVGTVLQTIVSSLHPQEQLELLDSLQQYLIGQGLLEEGKVACVNIS